MVPIINGETSQLESLSLVLSAVGIEHVFDEHTNQLLVARQDAELAVFHLNQYRQENRNWPPPPLPRPHLHPQTPPTVLMMGLLVLFFLQTGPWSAESSWFARGAIDTSAILPQGEWWRLVTALTLHADLVHLIGNCLIGGPMIHFLSKTIGYGLAWFFLILNGLFGNLLNVVLRQQPHISVGFSTSIFGAIGMLTGLQLGQLQTHALKKLVLPLGAGFGLLAFLGSEGVRTDLGAHFFGFVSGVCSGVLLSRTGVIERSRRPSLQAVLFSLSLALVALCWMLALR